MAKHVTAHSGAQVKMKLSDYLVKRDIRPIEFARELGVTPSIITRLLRGDRGASLELALKIEGHTSGAVRPSDLTRDAIGAQTLAGPANLAEAS